MTKTTGEMMTENEAKQHKFYKQAYDAHSGTSFSPERRAVSELEYYEEVCAEFRSMGKEPAIERFTALFLKSMGAKARVYSFMIAGPARFPVARMEKYNRWERAATDAMVDFVAKVRQPPAPPRTELDYGIDAKEYEIDDVKVLYNVEQNRLQLMFPGKPDPQMIVRLKSNGFKWSPRNTAWQRQLTPNALRSLRVLFPVSFNSAV